MALMNLVCPNCGGQAQIEAGRSAICPYCGGELASETAALVQGAFAQNVQFAPPPAQQMPVQQDPYAGMQNMPNAAAMFPPQEQLFTRAQLEAAKKKRDHWYALNAVMIAISAAVILIGVELNNRIDSLSTGLALSWILSHPLCGIISGLMRPDDAYIEKKPLFKSRFVQGIMHMLLSIPLSLAFGIVGYALLDLFLDLFR